MGPDRAERYTHGHHESVLRSHRWRTAQNSAAYLAPHLRSGQDLLDVGCGPGTITVDLATRVRPGRVSGIDTSTDVLAEARETATAAGMDVDFRAGDVYALPFADGEFDVVHAHQVLQHLTDPVAAVREMRRVTRPGGLVAVRDADYAAMTWYPASAGLDAWSRLYHQVTAANGAQADAGRRLLSWVGEAGFDPATIQASASTWCFATEGERSWWSALWAERSLSSKFAIQAVSEGLTDEPGLRRVADAWRAWGAAPDAWFVVLHGEVLARIR